MGRRRLNGREYKALFILSLVIPLGLLAAFRLTGILEEPVIITETVTLDAVKWEVPRPTRTTYPCDVLEATFDDGLLTKFDVNIWTYCESSSPNFYDYFRIGVEMSSSAEVPAAFVESVCVEFRGDCHPSLIWSVPMHVDSKNLSLASISNSWTYGEFGEASIRLSGTNHPHYANFSASVEWDLSTPNTENHQVEITFQLTYYNGTVYKKVVQPFQLKLYIGYHYLCVDAGILSIGETNVKVLVDGTEYFTPFSIIVSEGAHVIELQPVVQINSTTYDFDFWSALYGSARIVKGSAWSYNVTLSITADTQLRAFY